MLGVAAIKAPNFDLLVVFSALGAVGASLRQGLQAVVQAESDGVRGTVQGMLESWLESQYGMGKLVLILALEKKDLHFELPC